MSDRVRQLTSRGNEEFKTYLEALHASPNTPPPRQLLTDPATSEAVSFEAHIERAPLGRTFDNRAEFGHYLVDALKAADRTQISLNSSLWNWLALYYLDQLCPPDSTGTRRPEALARYYLPEKFRHNRYYRHLVRSPWLAVSLHPVTSRVILIPVSSKGSPLATVGEIFEQIASRQGVFRSTRIMAAVDALYFDPEKGRPRRGTAGSAGGSPRRLGHVLKQFELTYDLDWDNAGLVLGLLPREFDSWKHAG